MTYQSGPGDPGNTPYPGQQPPYPQPYPSPDGQQTAFPPGPPPYRAANDTTNGLAVASLITGLLGCVSFAGLILGIVALRQIGQRGGRGRGMAIAGIALFCVWAVVGVVGVALSDGSKSSGSSASPGGAPKPVRTAPAKIDVRKMHVG